VRTLALQVARLKSTFTHDGNPSLLISEHILISRIEVRAKKRPNCNHNT